MRTTERPPATAPNKVQRERVVFDRAISEQVDKKTGIRHNRLNLSGNSQEDMARMQVYDELGYAIYKNPNGLYVDLEIPQEKYLENEKRMHEEHLAQGRPRQSADREDGSMDYEGAVKDLGPMTPEQIAGIDTGTNMIDVTG